VVLHELHRRLAHNGSQRFELIQPGSELLRHGHGGVPLPLQRDHDRARLSKAVQDVPVVLHGGVSVRKEVRPVHPHLQAGGQGQASESGQANEEEGQVWPADGQAGEGESPLLLLLLIYVRHVLSSLLVMIHPFRLPSTHAR